MNKRILIDKSRVGDRTRVAVTIKGELIEYDEASSKNYIRAKNTIYNAVIKSIRPELGAAFVQYTDEANIKDGFLPFSNIATNYYGNPEEVKKDEEIAKLTSVNRRRNPQSHARSKRNHQENSTTKDLSKFDD